MIRRCAVLIALAATLALPAAAQADFGFAPGLSTIRVENRAGTLATQAGSHPYAFSFHFALNTVGGVTDGGAMRELIIELPTGMAGNPLAVPTCNRQDFEASTCEVNTQVGVLHVILPGVGEAVGPLYNLDPPQGVAAQVGFSNLGFTLVGSATVRSEEGYGVRVDSPNLPLEASSGTVTIWGTPADKGHDPERGSAEQGTLGSTSQGPLLPYLTLPATCLGPMQLGLIAVSKLNPTIRAEETVRMRDDGGSPIALTGCGSVPFAPAVQAAPSSGAAESAAGLNFQLSLPNKGLLNPKEGAVAETQPEKTVVTLPAGITANPAAVNGQGVCTLAQYKATDCPESSKLGTLTAQTPLLAEGIEGSVYLAAPHDNPFDSLLALYIVARAPVRGVLVKQAGRIDADPSTGQLTTTIEGLPPVPYSSFELRLREGARAPLITPQACGDYEMTAQLYPFSDPETATIRSAPFKVTAGANGGTCASSEAELPNHPAVSAGSTAPLAGGYSPFVFRLSREDGSQRFASVVVEPPAGLVAKLAGVPYCPEAGIASAATRTNEGDGAAELANPSCPAASQVGTVLAGAGAGPTPYYVQGKAYLAGPYKGAPLSLEIITPAIAGPFDLGVVAVRAGIYVNEETAKITVKSDPLPTILHGLPLDVRSVSVQMDRAQFTRNPTNCEPTTVGGSLTSLTGSIAPLSQRFQVGGCRGLGFRPGLKISLKGSTKRAGLPALKAVVTYPKEGDYANIASAQVGLPHSEFLEQANLDKVCTQPQLRSRTCPANSVYGKAKAWSPLLDKPLEGPVYLGVGFGHKLPDIVADLDGQIRILLHGKVDTTKAGGIRNTFEVVPDAPVSRFVLEMKGGKKYGLLTNSENVCRKPQVVSARFVAQNGKVAQLHPRIDNGCGGKGPKR
jgi:hypothetical protein